MAVALAAHGAVVAVQPAKGPTQLQGLQTLVAVAVAPTQKIAVLVPVDLAWLLFDGSPTQTLSLLPSTQTPLNFSHQRS